MRYKYQTFSYLFFSHKDITEQYFAEKSGALEGYSKDLFSRAYKTLFAESKNVKYLFDCYYQQEYNDFRDFLIRFYQLDDKCVDEMIEVMDNHPQYVLLDNDGLSVDGNLDTIIEYLEKRFEKIILMEI